MVHQTDFDRRFARAWVALWLVAHQGPWLWFLFRDGFSLDALGLGVLTGLVVFGLPLAVVFRWGYEGAARRVHETVHNLSRRS